MAKGQFGKTLRGGGVQKIDRGFYAMSGGQEIRFYDDPSTVGSVGCSEDDLINVLIDRMGHDALIAKLKLFSPAPEPMKAVAEEKEEAEAPVKAAPKKATKKGSRKKKLDI